MSVLVVIFVLLVAAGTALWAARTGRLPEPLAARVTRWLSLSWWFEPREIPHWEEPALNDTLSTPAASEEREPPPAPVRETPPVLPVPPAAVAAARVPDTKPDLPVIDLGQVAETLAGQRYRRHGKRTDTPVNDLPVIDRDSLGQDVPLRSRHRRVPTLGPERVLPVIDKDSLGQIPLRSSERRSKPVEARDLPLIDHDELARNLQSRTRISQSEPAQASRQDSHLPMIDPDEVRANLRMIHGDRVLKREPVSLPPRSMPLANEPVMPRRVTNPVRSVPSGAGQVDPVSLDDIDETPESDWSLTSHYLAALHRQQERSAARKESVKPPPVASAPAEPVSDRPVVPVIHAMPDAEPRTPVVKDTSPEPVPEPVATPLVVAQPVVPAPPEEVLPEQPDVTPAAVAATPEVPWVWEWQDPPAQAPQAAVPVSPEPQDLPVSAPVVVPDSLPAAEAAPLAPQTPPRTAHALPVVYGESCLPVLELLRPAEAETITVSEESLIERGILIEEKLSEFKVKVSVVDAYAGPVITRFEVDPAVGVRGSQVVNLVKDLSRALGLASIRVVETIPGKTCMGLELPNPSRQMIRLSDILGAAVFQEHPSRLAMALGKDITGQPVVMDLARAPHLLVAGTTGSGKSVGVNAMILSILYKSTPDDVRFIMIDPKMLELSVYNDIPHLLAPVVTDMKLAANALNWCVGEMERRYRLMSALGVRNLAGYNDKVREAEAAGQRLTNPFSLTPETPEPLTPLPFIVVVVDEFADLMMVAGKKIEELIARLAQKARAAGIHLILATQRPSVDVITGLIKANIPTRIAFQVSSKIDSRTILDQMGAEALLGQGDMLYLPPGTGYPQRVHGAFVADEEVHGVVEYLKQFGEPDYVEGLLSGEAEADEEAAQAAKANAGPESDPLYDEAVEIVMRTRKPSISSVQRHLRIGYNRAARLIEEMEAAGLVSAMESNGNRTVLVPGRDFS